MQSLKMVTSIAPKKLEVQQEAIRSWQNHGFQVVSFNHISEIEEIKPSFDEVIFLEAKTTAKELYKSDIPYVSVLEILKYIFNHKYPCWIANSDVILKTSGSKIARIQHLAKKTLVFGNRVDIEGNKFEGEVYKEGFDYFVLSSSIDHLFTSRTHMCMGQPWWDFWMPMTCCRKGVIPIICQKELVYHRKHNMAWNIDQYHFFGTLFAEELGVSNVDRSDLTKFAALILKHITEKSDTLTFKKKNARKKG